MKTAKIFGRPKCSSLLQQIARSFETLEHEEGDNIWQAQML